MLQKYKYMALGCLTYVPGLHAVLHRGTGGTNSSRYCYSVWMRHLVRNRHAGLGPAPQAIAELGPGDSLGIGLTALLCGAESYLALDAVPHARSEYNLAIFDELVRLLRDRARIPDDDEMPNLQPSIADYSFPHDVLPSELLDAALHPERVERLRHDVRYLTGCVRYASDWWQTRAVELASVDLIVSQAVLEHVNDVAGTYAAMHQWLRPGGFMSHQIDLKSHETSEVWNGHLGYSDLVWRIMRGRLPYLLNRVTWSGHLAAATRAGFTVVAAEKVIRHGGLSREQLVPQFREMPEEDLVAGGAFCSVASRPVARRMCGITGFVDRRLGGDRGRDTLLRMADAIVHRGPDQSGVWLENYTGVGLAHRRLSVLDLTYVLAGSL